MGNNFKKLERSFEVFHEEKNKETFGPISTEEQNRIERRVTLGGGCIQKRGTKPKLKVRNVIYLVQMRTIEGMCKKIEGGLYL